jgi:hypothetical protein
LVSGGTDAKDQLASMRDDLAREVEQRETQLLGARG